jgi:hypothetical protein
MTPATEVIKKPHFKIVSVSYHRTIGFGVSSAAVCKKTG